MERSYVKKSIALLALAAVAACAGGGGSGTSSIIPSQARTHDARPASLLTSIVGVGDSLTAGYQADGLLGQSDFENPLNAGHFVPPGQENGWWALLVEQASSSGSGTSLNDAIDAMYDPAKSPLPLIKGPGLDNQIVYTSGSSGEPFGQYKGTDPCTFDGAFNKAGFLLRGSARVRMNPNSTTIRDFGVPGLTLHEANWIHQPQTDTCSPLPGIPGLLSDVVTEESGTYWPVLRNFASFGGHLTEVNAAASVHPKLATVWLGANDVLKYMGSGGRFVGGDRSVAQVEGDLRATISTLKRAGAKVVLANLPNILETGYFQNASMTPANLQGRACKIRSYAACLLIGLAGLPNNVVNYYAKRYHLATANRCVPTSTTAPCGYITLAGALAIIQVFVATQGQYVDLDCMTPAPSCKPTPGGGLGANYITPEFAAKVQALNDTVNQGIDGAASANRVPLVDIHAIFQGLASGNPSNPYFHLASSIAPGVCCTLGYTHYPGYGFVWVPGGILSLDGIHPSNSGYGLIAYAFIDAIDKAYGMEIPQVDLQAVYKGKRCSNKRYCFPDPYAP
jgi:lysophospholipase L1-like esterase